MNRPKSHQGSVVTTPLASALTRLLGGHTSGAVTLTNDEFRCLRTLYGHKQEERAEKPPPPVSPVQKDFATKREYQEALLQYEEDVKKHNQWQDPTDFFQAGADRNLFREATVDGLRLIAWIAKYTSPGEDPLKTLIQFAIEAGIPVAPEDADWANENDENE